MPRLDCRRFLLAMALFLAPSFASAQAIEPGKEGELARLVRPQDGARACFARAYDAKHLEAHPDQKVSRMEFRLAYHRFEPDETYPQGQRNYYFHLLVQTRDRKGRKPLAAMGECSLTPDGKGIWCGVECDGGGVMLKRRDGGRLLVDLEATGRIRMTEGCDDEEGDGVDLLPGKDDKTFLLTKAPDAQCPAYDDW